MGLRYFLDVRATVRRMLEQMPGEQRTAFAAAVTERPLREDEQLPSPERLPQLGAWRPVLDSVWRYLAGDPAATREVEVALGRYYLSPDDHGGGPDDPGDAAAHAVNSSYTSERWFDGCLEFATWAGWRGFDWAAVRAAADSIWLRRRPIEASPYVLGAGPPPTAGGAGPATGGSGGAGGLGRGSAGGPGGASRCSSGCAPADPPSGRFPRPRRGTGLPMRTDTAVRIDLGEATLEADLQCRTAPAEWCCSPTGRAVPGAARATGWSPPG